MIPIVRRRRPTRIVVVGRRLCAYATLWTLLLATIATDVRSFGQAGPKEGAASARTIPDALRFAHGLFRQRRFDLAAEAYQEFLDAVPPPSQGDADDARFGLASARLLQGRYKEARAAFQEFLRAAPNHARSRTAWYRLGELSYMLGDLASARDALERFTSKPGPHPNLETAWTYLGDVCSSLGDARAARQAYEKSLAVAPNARLADRARYGLGRALASLGETQAALDVLNEVANRGGTDWIDKALLQIGKIQAEAGRFADAEQTFDRLAALEPPSSFQAEARFRRGAALARLDRDDEALRLLLPLASDPSHPLAADAAFAAAGVHLRRGRAADALQELDAALAASALSKSPLEPALLYRSAEALEALKRPNEARARFLKAAESTPDDPWADDAWLQAVRLASEAGDHAEVGKLAESFPKRFPKSALGPEVALLQARSIRIGGEPEAAVALLEPLVGAEAGPSAPALAAELDAAIRYELALDHRAAGDEERADAILATLTNSADAGFLLGQSRLKAGRYAEALAEFDRYLKDSPNGQVADHALAHRAAAELGLGRRDEAAKTLVELERRFPESPALPPARLRVAEAAAGAGDFPEAIEHFKALVAPPSDAKSPEPPPEIRERAELGLARALVKQGDAAGAAAVFEAVAARAKDEGQAAALALERGKALEAAGKIDEAAAAFEQVETRFPADPSALHAGLARARLLAQANRPAEAARLIGKLVEDEGARKRLEALGQPIDALLAERAWALADAGESAEADAVFKDLLKSFPTSGYAADARFNLAESANQKKDFAEVVRLLSPLVTPEAADAPRPPDRLLPLVLYRMGRTRVETGEWDAAASTLSRLIAEFPGDARVREARLLRAEADLRRDRFEAAEADLASLADAPASTDDPPGFARIVAERRLQALLGLNRWKDALALADGITGGKSAPPNAEIQFARGRALLGLARPEEARAAFQRVIDATPGSDLAAQAQLMRGEAYFHEDRLREARIEYLKVDVLYPHARRWRAAALLEAGKVDERLGQWAEAAETYDRLLADLPDEPGADEAAKRRAAVLEQHRSKATNNGDAR